MAAPGRHAGDSERGDRVDPVSQVLERLSGRPAAGGRYELEGELARGGMGAILRVWDTDLRRHLAMKVIATPGDEEAPPDAPDERLLGRFLEEAQVTGQLDHPGVVPVHELGRDADGRVFFTMKLVKGRNLKEVFDLVRSGEEGWTRVRALGVLLKVCEAMAYAHDKGVVHRDLKPANVMVGRFGEVYVMDWGLAKVLGQEDHRDLRLQEPVVDLTRAVESARRAEAADDPDSPLVTLDGEILGTPAYMPPEQAQGRLEQMGPHSDVYSLGAMLYHLLAGHAPYLRPGVRLTNYGILRLVQSIPPDALQARAPDASAEIVAICEKAMAREPGQRYRDMSELAEDLHAYVAGRVVRAYETGAVAELKKWVSRNRGLAGALSAVVVALVVGLLAALLLRSESERRRRNVLRLSTFAELAELRARADRLWPVHPDLISDYEQWLDDARALIAGLDSLGGEAGLRAQLAELRARGRPRDPARIQELVGGHPDHDRLVRLESELQALDLAAAVRTGGASVPEPDPTPLQRGLPAVVLNDLAWDLVKPDRTVFAREPEGRALARLAWEVRGPEDDASEFADTLAWASSTCGLDAEALRWSREALALAGAGERQQYETRLERVEQAVASAGGEEQRARVEALRRAATRLREEVEGAYAWVFAGEQTAWWHERLATLVRELDELADAESGLIEGVSARWGLGIQRRLAAARRIEDLSVGSERARDLWSRASAAIAAHEAYRLQLPPGGLAPQVGLVPLGPDPDSGLWEFAHVLSGEVPRRSGEDRDGDGWPDGPLALDEDSAIVLVLVPGGEFVLGAQAEDPDLPNYDLLARPDEAPVLELRLDSFFLAKHEMTQAQWLRFTSENPSRHRWGHTMGGKPILGTNPVENMSWGEATGVLARMDLVLPTEAQWERAARAGTHTPWYVGSDPADLAGHANLADGSAGAAGLTWTGPDDGFAGHAPIASFAANPYGLHDVLGNVGEWCRNGFGSYHLALRSGDGSLAFPVEPPLRAVRGGSQMDGPEQLRCAYRLVRAGTFRFPNLGLRPAREVRP